MSCFKGQFLLLLASASLSIKWEAVSHLQEHMFSIPSSNSSIVGCVILGSDLASLCLSYLTYEMEVGIVMSLLLKVFK